MLAAIVLLGLVALCAGLAFLSEESIENLRAKAFEAKRWIRLKLDSLGQPPVLDADSDLEAGVIRFRQVREAVPDAAKRVVVVPLPKPMHGGPIRRSVHRGQVSGGASTHVSTSPSSEYGSLFDRTTEQLQHEQRQLEQQLHNQQHHNQHMLHSQQQLPRPLPLSTAKTVGGGLTESRARPPPYHGQRRGISFDANATVAGRPNTEVEAANETCSARGNFALPRTVFPDDTKSPTFGAEGLPANVVAAFREHGSAGEQAEPMPSYVPVQKQGSLSKATHRRASIRTGSADASAAEGGVSGGAGRATGPDSPFFAVRSPPKFLPPVPAFGGSDLAASPAPPPPPPSLNESHNRATEADCFDYAFLPPAVDSLPEVSRQAGQSESPGGSMAGGELEDVRAGALGSQAPLPAGNRGTTVTTPKRRGRHDEFLGRDPSFFAAPSPDGDQLVSLDEERLGSAADRTATEGERGEVSADTFWDDVAANREMVSTSPAWSVEADVHRGTGVRRRISPRAGGRSPRGGAGWAPASPPRQEEYAGGDDRLRPRTLTFPDEAPLGQSNELIVDARAGEERGGTGVAEETMELERAWSASPMNVSAEAPTPLAGEGGAAGVAAAGGTATKGAEAGVITEAVVRPMGLRCSSPIYNRGKNMLGTSEEPSREEQVSTSPRGKHRDPPTAPCGKTSGTPNPQGVADDEWLDLRASDGTKQEGAGKKGDAEPIAPVAKPRDEAEGTQDKVGGGQNKKQPGEHPREGRDLSSSDAFAASLDLPFEELELTKLIGGGGFGQVYRGVWRGTPVAVKVLVPVAQRDLDDELAADFSAEVLMLAALRHPNVCLFMGACMVPPNRAIVTELVSRGSLWEALRDDRLPAESLEGERGAFGAPLFSTPRDCWPWPVIVKVAEGVACGMNYLHRHEPFPILHRDLKSANLLLDECFNVKICDFGLARLKAFTNSMTGNCGTVQWMAPEVLASEKYTETADVYSFAIVCWEMLTRICPYEGMSQIQVAVAVLNDKLRPEIPKWCPGEFSSLIENGWQHEPSRRSSFGDILERVRHSLPPSHS